MNENQIEQNNNEEEEEDQLAFTNNENEEIKKGEFDDDESLEQENEHLDTQNDEFIMPGDPNNVNLVPSSPRKLA